MYELYIYIYIYIINTRIKENTVIALNLGFIQKVVKDKNVT